MARKPPAAPAAKTSRKGTPPPVQGRRGHSSIDQQQGLAEKIDKWLLEEPRPTYDEMIERLKETGFWVSRSALARHGFKFEIRRRETRMLIDKARLLAQDDPDSILELERAIANLANVKIFENLLDPALSPITEVDRDVMNVAARMQSSSSSRERARMAHSRGVKSATAMIKAELERQLKENPEALKIVLKVVDKARAEIER